MKREENNKTNKRRRVNSVEKRKASKCSINKDNSSNISKGLDILEDYQEKRTEKIQEAKETVKKLYVKTKNEEVKDVSKNTSKKKLNISLKPIVITFVVLVIFIALYFIYIYGPIFGISLNKNSSINDGQIIDLISSEQDIYRMYNQNLLVYSDKAIKVYNSSADEVLNFELPENFTPDIVTDGSYMLVSNDSSNIVYLFERNNEILNKKLDGDIKNIYINSEGYFAVEYSTVGYKRIIEVYNKNGDVIYKVTLEGSEIFDLKILDSAKKLLIVQSDTSSLTIGISVKIVDITNDSENIKEIAKIDNSLLQNLTINGQNIIMLLDNKIIKCNINSGEIVTIEDFSKSQISHVSLSSTYYTMIGDTIIDDGSLVANYTFQNIRFDTTSIYSGKVYNLPKVIKNTGLLTYLIYQDRLMVINKWGQEIKNMAINFSPKDVVVFNNEKSFALIYTNKIYIINI